MEFYIETYGCAANKSDSEIIAGILSRNGLVRVNSPKYANLIIINTCVVKGPTINKILHRTRKLIEKFPTKKFLIAGCMPEAYPELIKKNFPRASMISTNRIVEIGNAVRKIFKGKRIEILGKLKKEKVCLPKLRENKIIDIVQICSGCLGNCSYCATKLAKGNLISFSPEKIVKEIKMAKSNGAKEFWLTGQDISCYGFDIEFSLPKLLEKILCEVEGKYFIRLGMLNPKHLEKIINQLLEVCTDNRIFKFFHIPVQSGSNKILTEMNRSYSVEVFEGIINKIRKKFPMATIWTDIIVGYPKENDKDFNETLNLIKKIKPDWVNVSKFYLMNKTNVKEFPKTEIAKERSRIASEFVKKIAIEKIKKWDGWEGEVLVDNFFRKKLIGRNFTYRAIHLPFSKNLIGKFLKVKARVEGLKIVGNCLKDKQ